MPANFLNYILNQEVVVKRRIAWDDASATRDALNAPSYGTPDNWKTIYSALKCRIEYVGGTRSGSRIEFRPTGERVKPIAIMFIDDDMDIRAEDRIIDSVGVFNWIVEGKQILYNTVGGIHHYEYQLNIP
jgi:hypothetical protein